MAYQLALLMFLTQGQYTITDAPKEPFVALEQCLEYIQDLEPPEPKDPVLDAQYVCRPVPLGEPT